MHFQSTKFQATPAQVAYLRAIHLGTPFKTNYATVNRCFRMLEFRDGRAFVKPEIVKHFNLDAEEPNGKFEAISSGYGYIGTFDTRSLAQAALRDCHRNEP